MTGPITHADAASVIEVGMRLGTLPSFTYVLAMQVLHRMSKASTRQIMLPLPSLYGTVLTDSFDRIVAGQVETLVHEGIGFVSDVGATRISAHYITALQKLHWSGVLLSDIVEARLDDPEFQSAGAHFTMLPNLREGAHWNEKTPMVYRLPDATLEEVLEQFAPFCNNTTVPGEKAAFL